MHDEPLVIPSLENESGNGRSAQRQCHRDHGQQHFERTHPPMFLVFKHRQKENACETALGHDQPAGDCGTLFLLLVLAMCLIFWMLNSWWRVSMRVTA